MCPYVVVSYLRRPSSVCSFIFYFRKVSHYSRQVFTFLLLDLHLSPPSRRTSGTLVLTLLLFFDEPSSCKSRFVFCFFYPFVIFALGVPPILESHKPRSFRCADLEVLTLLYSYPSFSQFFFPVGSYQDILGPFYTLRFVLVYSDLRKVVVPLYLTKNEIFRTRPKVVFAMSDREWTGSRVVLPMVASFRLK